jgi:hypothetical protein
MLTKNLTTSSGFRLMRCFSVEHNAARFRKHVERLGRSMKRELRPIRMKTRRLKRAAV